MKRYLLFLSLCTLPFTSQAEKGQSIMFGDQDPLYSDSRGNKSCHGKSRPLQQPAQADG